MTLGATQVCFLKSQVVNSSLHTSLGSYEIIDHLKTSAPGGSLGGGHLTGGSQGAFEITDQAFRVEPLLALGALSARAESPPRMPTCVRPLKQLLKELLLLCNQGNLLRLLLLISFVQEVGLVLEEGVHPARGHTQDVPGVLVNALLQVQNVFIPGGLGELPGFFLSLFLEEMPCSVGVKFLLPK